MAAPNRAVVWPLTYRAQFFTRLQPIPLRNPRACRMLFDARILKEGRHARDYPGARERTDAGMHRQLLELPRRLPRDSDLLPAKGRAPRREVARPALARLRGDLPDERQLHAAQLAVARDNVRRLRGDLRTMRRRVRKVQGRHANGGLRANVSHVRRVLPGDGCYRHPVRGPRNAAGALAEGAE